VPQAFAIQLFAFGETDAVGECVQGSEGE